MRLDCCRSLATQIICICVMSRVITAIFKGKTIFHDTVSGESEWSKYAFIASISASVYDEPSSRSYFTHCSGVIIDSHWILTAASCVMVSNNPALEIYIDYGTDNSVNKIFRKIYSHDTVSIVYPSFQPNTPSGDSFQDDIALIKLPPDQPLDLDDVAAKKILLPDRRFDWDKNILKRGDLAVIAGFGPIDSNPGVNILYIGDVKLTQQQDCRPRSDRSNSTLYCVATENQRASPCKFDTGGPLAWKDSLGRFWLMGIIPHVTHQCEHPPASIAYLSIIQYLTWIADTGYVYGQKIESLAQFTTISLHNNGLDQGKVRFRYRSLYYRNNQSHPAPLTPRSTVVKKQLSDSRQNTKRNVRKSKAH